MVNLFGGLDEDGVGGFTIGGSTPLICVSDKSCLQPLMPHPDPSVPCSGRLVPASHWF